MKPLLRAVALVLGLSLVAGFSACSKTPAASSSAGSSSAQSTSSETVQKLTKLSLPVVLPKSLNPLTTDNYYNFLLWPLMYDCLAEPDTHYEPVPELASSINLSGTKVTVQLRSVRFSDGTALTSKDVQFSYQQVMGDASSFLAPNVANISSVSTQGNSTVVFYLKSPDPLFANLLNIPIIKSNTDHLNDTYPTDGINRPPVGSGKYVFSTNSFNGTLTANKNWYKGATPGIQSINLVNLLNSSVAYSSLKVGEINYLFSDYGNAMTPTVGLSTANVNLNRMVFLGVNSKKPGLSDESVRSAVSSAINRKTIVSSIFSSKAAAANVPFNPDWSALPRLSDAQASSNYAQAQKTLSDDGYTATDASGALTGSQNGQTTTLAYKLLVDSSDTLLLSVAKEISNDLSNTGIQIEVDAESSDVYNADLSGNNFDLYLGQINLLDDMDISPLLTPGAPAAFGVPDNSSTLAAFNAWRSGSGKIEDVSSAFIKETPFVPVCFRYGSVSYSKGLPSAVTPTFYNIFFGIENWHL